MTTYTTSDKVAGLLGITAFDGTSRPTKTFVESIINSYEDQIDTWTKHAWRGIFGKLSKLEYYDIRSDFYTSDGYQIIYLNHRSVRAFNSGIYSISVSTGGTDYTTATVEITNGGGTGATATATIEDGAITSITITDEGVGYTSTPTITITGDGSDATATCEIYGDVLEIFDGKNWIDYISTKTEGRSADYFVNESDGILYVRGYFILGNDYVRCKYRYGETTVDSGIELACTKLVASDIMQQDDRATVALPDGNLSRSPDINSMANKHKYDAMRIIDSKQEINMLI